MHSTAHARLDLVHTSTKKYTSLRNLQSSEIQDCSTSTWGASRCIGPQQTAKVTSRPQEISIVLLICSWQRCLHDLNTSRHCCIGLSFSKASTFGDTFKSEHLHVFVCVSVVLRNSIHAHICVTSAIINLQKPVVTKEPPPCYPFMLRLLLLSLAPNNLSWTL